MFSPTYPLGENIPTTCDQSPENLVPPTYIEEIVNHNEPSEMIWKSERILKSGNLEIWNTTNQTMIILRMKMRHVQNGCRIMIHRKKSYGFALILISAPLAGQNYKLGGVYFGGQEAALAAIHAWWPNR